MIEPAPISYLWEFSDWRCETKSLARGQLFLTVDKNSHNPSKLHNSLQRDKNEIIDFLDLPKRDLKNEQDRI